MDSRELQPPQPPQLQSMGQAQPPSGAPNMMMAPNSFGPVMQNPNTSTLINPNSTTPPMAPATASRFPFNSVVSQPPASSKPMEHLNNNASPYDGSSPAMRSCGFHIDSTKKKRGRPRKYSDGNIALGLTPTPVSTSAGQGDSAGTPSTEPGAKKHRGRPPGSGKRQMDALGAGGVGFTPHVIMINAGEDIAGKIVAFSQQGPRTVCVLSAIGAVSNVSLRQSSISGGTVQYEGRFEIISLSGSFLPSCEETGRNRAGGFSVSLAGSDGKVLGGGVAGMLVAASPVQVVVGSFIADGKKSSSNAQKSGPSSTSGTQMLNFGAHTNSTSPTSQGPSSESSEENENNGDFNRGPALYNNNSQTAIHNMQMYHPLWAGQTQQ